jgi:sugar phosphate isomerase/epimerase
MPALGPESLVFNTTNILGGGVREIVAAAIAGEYDAISIWPHDVERARAEGLTLPDIRHLLEDSGLVVSDVDPLLAWSDQGLPKPGEAMIELAPEDSFYEIGEALEARSINVVQGFGSTLDLDRAAEDLARVCRRANEHGLLVTFEFLPWTGVPDVTVCLDLLTRTGCDNATIMFDSWHWFRGARDLDALRAIPGDRIGSTQFNDAPEKASDNLPREAMEARLSPGEGDIPLVDLVRALDEIGSRAPIGVEVIHARHEQMDPSEVGRYTAADMRRVLAEARGGA